MKLKREELRKLLKAKGVKTLDDVNLFMSEISKDVVETLLEGELTNHLGFEKYDHDAKTFKNSRNGYSSKKVKVENGEVDLKIPRDREAKFEPQIVKKYQKDISGMEDKIIAMYARGMSTRDIQSHIEEIYNYSLSAEKVSNITDAVLVKAKEWQFRPLEEIYAVVFIDATFLKMRKDGVVRKVAVYNVIGINMDGRKECLGIWIYDSESSKYWLTVLNELKNRGVEDILIFCVDNLRGISEAIETVYQKSEIQKCIVHQIRNSLKYVSYKDRKSLANDLKSIYKASSEKEGSLKLEDFAKSWDKKYPNISDSWHRNWSELSTFFKYPEALRTLIYTTNTIESVNRQIKKVTKNKAAFPTEQSVIKSVYLAITYASKKWTTRVRNWSRIYPQLMVFFKERLEKFND